MQDEVRNIVLSYLRAREVPFVWRDGFVEIPDTTAIRALASGRPSLSLSFDRDAAQLLPNVDYVTFGHPMFDAIRDELKGQAVYIERQYGFDVRALLAEGLPFVTWEDIEPGSVVPEVQRPVIEMEDVLLVRLQLDIESDFRHMETFAVPVDLQTGQVVPDRATIGRRSSQLVPAAYAPPQPAQPIEVAITRACTHAQGAIEQLLDLKRNEAERRLRAELTRAHEGGLEPERIAHLERELGRKYDVTARVHVVGVERWYVQTGLLFEVRVPAWGPEARFTIRYSHEARTTEVEVTRGRGTPDSLTHVRLCRAKHADTERSPLIPCAGCGERYCQQHVEACEATGALCCDRDLEKCHDDDHQGRVLRKVLRRIGGQRLCTKHIKACDECQRECWSRELASCASTGSLLCSGCRVACHDCPLPVSKNRAPKCAQSGAPLCRKHVVKCDHLDCGRSVASSLLVRVDSTPALPPGPQLRKVPIKLGAYCREHVGTCAVGHDALLHRLTACAVTGKRRCPRHMETCSCGRVVAPEVVSPSAASGKPICQACQVICVDCSRKFLAEETEKCALSGEQACRDDLRGCQHADCNLRIRSAVGLVFQGRTVCPSHACECPSEPAHSTLRDLLRPCGATESSCSTSTCQEGSHTCQRCGQARCADHLLATVGGISLRTCRACLFQGPLCGRCYAPLSHPGCPLCAGLGPYEDIPPPEAIVAACKAEDMACGRTWRKASSGAAQLWEQRVGLRVERFLLLKGEPTVHRSTSGFLGGMMSILSGS